MNGNDDDDVVVVVGGDFVEVALLRHATWRTKSAKCIVSGGSICLGRLSLPGDVVGSVLRLVDGDNDPLGDSRGPVVVRRDVEVHTRLFEVTSVSDHAEGCPPSS